MRRTHHLLLTTLLVAASSAPALAQFGPPDAQSIRPAVMLMVDTSGSMERVPDDGTNPNCDSCVPTCTGDTLIDRNNKTRWALTVEALTGTIQDYTCTSVDRSSYANTEYDYGYYLPHIDFGRTPTQASDGILDSFGNRVKFGLMTFDGVGTTLGGDTLVPYHTWFDDSGFQTAAYGAPGMFSYGDVGRLAFPGCLVDYGINAGARGEGTHPGALISVPKGDAVDDALAVSSRIQQSLLDVRPFGGTPIAGMLDDLRFYLQNNLNVSSDTRGDPLFVCRDRKAVLITDGAPDAMFRDTRFNCGIEEPPSGGSGRVVNASCTAPNTHAGGAFLEPGCSCPYKKPSEIATELTAGSSQTRLLESLIVVAYNVHDKTALDGLEEIAWSALRPEDRQGPIDYITHRDVVQADSAGQLKSELEKLLNAMQPGVTSRAVPVSVTVGDPVISGNSKRFDITAGFQVGQNPAEPWQGLLYRGRADCNGTEVVEENFSKAAGDVFHETLTDQTSANQRVLITATPEVYGPVDGSLVNAAYRPAPISAITTPYDNSRNYDSTRLATNWQKTNTLRPDGSNFSISERAITDLTPVATQGLINERINVPDVANPNFVNTTALNALYFGDANRDNTPGTAQDRAAVVDYVLGRGRPNALADIYHSQPVVMVPISSANESQFITIDAKHTGWLRTLSANSAGSHYSAGRPGVVFVGTNDGLLHAFNLDDWQNRGGTVAGGHELWAFAPPALFGKMASMIDSHQIGFDGSPQVKDVVLQQRTGSEPIYRSILVSAVRGAHAFVALDVTFPEEPVFLWQFSAPDVGNTIGNVALTQVTVNWNGEGNQVRAVAILPGGEGVAAASCPNTGFELTTATRAKYPLGNTRNVRCWNRRGRALYVVDVATGQLIQEFGPEHFPSPLTGSVVVDSRGATNASAAYFFDHDGVLWRLSMLSTDPQNWKAAPIYDMFMTPPTPSDTSLRDFQLGRHPVYAPSLTRDRNGNLVILAGTGDVDSPRDPARNRVVSLTEERVREADGEIEAVIKLNWRIDLKQNETVTGPLSLFQDAVYFATFEAGAGDPCGLGISRLWGAHAYQPLDKNANPPEPTPHLVGKDAGPADPYILNEEYSSQSGLVLGVTVKQQPICQSSSRIYNATTQQYVSTGASGGGAYQLSAMMAGSSADGHTRSGDIGRGAVVEMAPRTVRVTNTTRVTSWASMFE
jgi:type IV pilus assembly protein PilY1